MATIKSFTDLSQSKKLAEFLSPESADMCCFKNQNGSVSCYVFPFSQGNKAANPILCWSLAALLKCLSEIKPLIYTPVLFPSEGKWILQFVEYSHGNVCEISYDNPIDACVEMIIKLKERKLI